MYKLSSLRKGYELTKLKNMFMQIKELHAVLV